jgi:glutaredoxin
MPSPPPLDDPPQRPRCLRHGLLVDDAGRCHRCDAGEAELIARRIVLRIVGAFTAVAVILLVAGLGLRAASAFKAESVQADSTPPASGSVKIVVVGAGWCRYCKTARSWLSARGYAYEYHDVDDKATDRFLRDEAKLPVGRVAIPIIGIDGHYTTGFDAARLASDLRSAEERRAHGG